MKSIRVLFVCVLLLVLACIFSEVFDQHQVALWLAFFSIILATLNIGRKEN